MYRMVLVAAVNGGSCNNNAYSVMRNSMLATSDVSHVWQQLYVALSPCVKNTM